MRIAIDVVPIRITGDVSKAAHLVLELIRELALQNPGHQFLLLTAAWNHQYFEQYEQYGVERLLVAREEKTNPGDNSLFAKIRRKLLMTRLGKYFRKINGLTKSTIFKVNDIDLIFCPMTAITYVQPGIPTVITVHDLEHEYYLQFFSNDELQYRQRVCLEIVQVADVLTCFSEYIKRILVEKYNCAPERIYVIPSSLPERLKYPVKNELERWLSKNGLIMNEYIFYPAKFCTHKNHRILLTAFNIYVKKRQVSNLKLVLLGIITSDNKDINDAIKIMGLEDQILIMEYVSDEELEYLFAGCKYVIYPSLFEGCGMEIIEAMAFGKPVLCSDTTGLPEVGGDAPLYFDPRKPEEIVACMEQISDSRLVDEKIAKGLEQVKHFGFREMVIKYSEVLNLASSFDSKLDYKCEGVYSDGWSGESIRIVFGSSKNDRTIQVELTNLNVNPAQIVKACVYLNGQQIRKQALSKNSTMVLLQDIGRKSGILVITFAGTFIPKDLGIDDERVLGVQVPNISVRNTHSQKEIKKLI